MNIQSDTRSKAQLRPPGKDRRVRRTHRAGDALRMALDGSAKRGGLAAVVVTDDFGMLVSHSNASFELDMLAAVTPLVARGGTRARVEHRGQPCELKVQSIDLLGERLHFACLGGNARGRAMAMRDSLAATQRILA